MRIVRSFSTSLWHAKQALYEPYVAPLNEEQKKALRKVMARSAPTYHGRLSKDIRQLLESYQPTRSLLTRREETTKRVGDIIKDAFGHEYSVIDRSLHTYACDIDIAPIELAIHDCTRPKGFPPGTEGQPLPDPYRHEVLANLLQSHGYTGCFVVGDAERTTPRIESEIPQIIEERGPLPTTPRWPSFDLHPVSYLTYPPVLYAKSESDLTLPFFLSPPTPAHIPLIKLLRQYTLMNPSFSDLIPLILLWVRSIDLPQLTPMCVALMVIGFLQNVKTLSSLQNPKNPLDVQRLAQMDEHIWIRAEWPPRYEPKTFELETAFIKPTQSESSLRPKTLGPLLLEFFRFWSQENTSKEFISSTQCLSIREGIAVSRVPVTKNTGAVINRDTMTDRSITAGKRPWSPTSEPIMWQTQPIVIQDPFIPSYNHAQSLSKSACAYFHYFNSLSQRALFRGHPLITVFGPHLPPPQRYSRKFSTDSVEQGVRRIYESLRPPPPVLAARARTISRVQDVITNKFGPGYIVETFGSTRYGVSSATSDLDLVIKDLRHPGGFTPDFNISRAPVIYNMKKVANVLYRTGFARIVAIPKATVPIVKFRDPATGLDCDINTNDQLGLWNTLLIQRYCDISPNLVRPMIMIIKQWAKSHGLNDPSGQNGPVTFSSYALVLMVIGYLQSQGVLPNLQAGFEPLPGGITSHTFWIKGNKKKAGPVRCDIRFWDSVDGWRSEVQMGLGEALEGWFRFWHNHNFTKELLSIRHGGLIHRVHRKPEKGSKKPKPKTHNSPGDVASMLEMQAAIRDEGEDAALLAWQSESESASEDDEDAIAKGTEGETMLLGDAEPAMPLMVEVDNPTSEEVQTQALRTGLADLEQQPARWTNDTFIVADPFIVAKNVCGNIRPTNIELFKMECRRSAHVLSSGGDLQDLMGDGKPAPGGIGRKRGEKPGAATANSNIQDRGKGKTKVVESLSGQRDGDVPKLHSELNNQRGGGIIGVRINERSGSALNRGYRSIDERNTDSSIQQGNGNRRWKSEVRPELRDPQDPGAKSHPGPSDRREGRR